MPNNTKTNNKAILKQKVIAVHLNFAHWRRGNSSSLNFPGHCPGLRHWFCHCCATDAHSYAEASEFQASGS